MRSNVNKSGNIVFFCCRNFRYPFKCRARGKLVREEDKFYSVGEHKCDKPLPVVGDGEYF